MEPSTISPERVEQRTPAAAPKAPRLRRFLASAQARVGLVMFTLAVGIALVGPFFTPYSSTAIIGTPFDGPSGKALLGTDTLGRDVLSRVLDGGYNLLWMAVLATIGGVIVGTAVGLTAAYRGGLIDSLLMRVIDVLLTFPTLLLAMLFVSMLGPSTWLLVLLIIIGHTPGMSRVMRGAAIPVVKQDHVLWAQTLGLSRRHIVLREVLPLVTSPLVVEFGLRLMWSVSILASLSFLGFGRQPPASGWGLMINENRDGIQVQPWAVVVPIACIAIFTVGTNLLAEAAGRVLARTEGKGSAL